MLFVPKFVSLPSIPSMCHSNFSMLLFSVALTVGLASCSHSRYNGKHSSVNKEQELKSKSDFNLKQAKVIVDENEKNRPKNERRAERRRKKINKQLESEGHSPHQNTPTNHHNNTNKPVPSFP